jgi:hypothetical protein
VKDVKNGRGVATGLIKRLQEQERIENYICELDFKIFEEESTVAYNQGNQKVGFFTSRFASNAV